MRGLVYQYTLCFFKRNTKAVLEGAAASPAIPRNEARFADCQTCAAVRGPLKKDRARNP